MNKMSRPIARVNSAQFPDLNLLNFYFWSHLKSVIYYKLIKFTICKKIYEINSKQFEQRLIFSSE